MKNTFSIVFQIYNMKKHVFEAFSKFTKMKNTFLKRFSLLKNEKYVFNRVSNLKMKKHVFEAFFEGFSQRKKVRT